MEYVTYSLQAFNADLASKGHLCVLTSYGFADKTISSDSGSFKKSCIPTAISPIAFSTVFGGATLTFNKNGLPSDLASKDYQLFLASVANKEVVQLYGNAIKRTKKVTTIRTENGVETKVEEYKPVKGEPEAAKNVLVSALNARDNFAIQALNCIMKFIPDLKDIGDDERDFYCKMAYQWAANMMDNAAQVRATFEDETHSTEQSTDITELETNTDKLLNNILFTMEKSQQTTIDGENQIVSERIVNPELNNRIDKLEAAIKAQTTAINNQITAINSLKNTLNTTLERIATALENEHVEPDKEKK